MPWDEWMSVPRISDRPGHNSHGNDDDQSRRLLTSVGGEDDYGSNLRLEGAVEVGEAFNIQHVHLWKEGELVYFYEFINS